MFLSFVRCRMVSNSCRPALLSYITTNIFSVKIYIMFFLCPSTKPRRRNGAWPHTFQSSSMRSHPPIYDSPVSCSRVVPEVVLPGIELVRKLLSTHSAYFFSYFRTLSAARIYGRGGQTSESHVTIFRISRAANIGILGGI
jgi:hypothetical protein